MPKLIKFKTRINCLSGFPTSLAYCWPRPSILHCTVRKALFLCAYVTAQNLSLPRWSWASRCPLGSQAHHQFRETSHCFHMSTVRKELTSFSHHDGWFPRVKNETRCLNPFPSKARLGLPVTSPLAAEPSLRRQTRQAQSEWVFNLISRIMYPPQVQNLLWS